MGQRTSMKDKATRNWHRIGFIMTQRSNIRVNFTGFDGKSELAARLDLPTGTPKRLTEKEIE